MKWIMEHIGPAGLVLLVTLALGAICTVLLAADGPVQDFANSMISELGTL